MSSSLINPDTDHKRLTSPTAKYLLHGLKDKQVASLVRLCTWPLLGDSAVDSPTPEFVPQPLPLIDKAKRLRKVVLGEFIELKAGEGSLRGWALGLARKSRCEDIKPIKTAEGA